jgi:7,8-dihydropterin-6-yl-methyl-4-(beta-D-ribofuranosyl)aminobenzene 5'-phosphate synthase
MTPLVFIAILILAVLFALFVVLWARFKRGKARADRYWEQSRNWELDPVGTTRTLEILPLIDWYTNRENLTGEAGVSYWLKTDEKSVLFDVGYNPEQRDPSPLLNNMKELGIGIDDFDTIFISHNHPDHVGGMTNMRRKSFSLTGRRIDLQGKAVYTPVPMSYPNLNPVCVEKPTPIAKGMASIGTIPNQLFFLGWTMEQALACDVEDKGIVLVVGCGHQTLPRIVERAEALFDRPLFGLVGGLHYPVGGGRDKMLGIEIERYVGTGKPPWRPVTMDEVRKNIDFLKSRNPKVVALSAHDSSDASLAAFRDTFGEAYRELRVGERILI